MIHHRSRQFSLVELFVVIAILLALATLLQPALLSALRSAARISCMNIQRQLGVGIELYSHDNDGLVPPNAGTGDGHTSRNATQIRTWANMQLG